MASERGRADRPLRTRAQWPSSVNQLHMVERKPSYCKLGNLLEESADRSYGRDNLVWLRTSSVGIRVRKAADHLIAQKETTK
jgi:hypothetical protein